MHMVLVGSDHSGALGTPAATISPPFHYNNQQQGNPLELLGDAFDEQTVKKGSFITAHAIQKSEILELIFHGTSRQVRRA